MNEEGVIKFSCNWIKGEPIDDAELNTLNAWRDRLYALQLLGVTDDGIGYGNISRRVPRGFIITGSGSGRLSKLSSANYTVVTAYDLASNSVTSVGPVMASSESMTHAAIYKTDKNANAVFHMHHRGLWMHLLKWYPSTAKDVAYGTPEMAAEVTKLIHQLNGKLIFAMGGHEDGIISFGTDEDQAGQVVLDELKKLS